VTALLVDVYPTDEAHILVHLQSGETIPLFWGSLDQACSLIEKVSVLWRIPFQVALIEPPTAATIVSGISAAWREVQAVRRLNLPPEGALTRLPMMSRRILIEPTSGDMAIEEPGKAIRQCHLRDLTEMVVTPLEEGTRQDNEDDPDTYLYTYDLSGILVTGERLPLKVSRSEEARRVAKSVAQTDAERTAAFLRSLALRVGASAPL
jgi:hypothetical protein